MRNCQPDLLHALGGRWCVARPEERRPPCCCASDCVRRYLVLSKLCHGISILYKFMMCSNDECWA